MTMMKRTMMPFPVDLASSYFLLVRYFLSLEGARSLIAEALPLTSVPVCRCMLSGGCFSFVPPTLRLALLAPVTKGTKGSFPTRAFSSQLHLQWFVQHGWALKPSKHDCQ